MTEREREKERKKERKESLSSKKFFLPSPGLHQHPVTIRRYAYAAGELKNLPAA